MSLRIATIAQADQVHDKVHSALDKPPLEPLERWRRKEEAILATSRLLSLLSEDDFTDVEISKRRLP